MRLKKIIGLVVLLLLGSACTKMVPDSYDTGNPMTKYRTFGFLETKSQLYFNWKDGQQVCVYSLDGDGTIMFKDTCVVKESNGHMASITAEVAKEAVTYWSCYPFDAIDAEVGETVNTNYKRRNGNFETAAVLVSEEPSTATTLYFDPAMSMVSIGSYTIFGLSSVSDIRLHFYIKEIDDIEVTAPASFGFNDSNPYYIPIASETVTCTKFTATINFIGYRTVTKYPTKRLEPGHIYPYQFSFVK